MLTFSDQQKQKILKNDNVLNFTETQIVFSPTFKLKAVSLSKKGESGSKIFADAGFDFGTFSVRYMNGRIHRWSRIYAKEGKSAFMSEKRGKKSTGRPKKQNFDIENLSREDLLAIIDVQKEIIAEIKKRQALKKEKKER